MRLRTPFFVALALALGAAALPVRSAHACGGFFSPPSAQVSVSGHRMVLSISSTQTVLWDQIQYQGDPADFAWVLPIKPGARVEPSTAAFFEVMEALTQRTITGPTPQCDTNPGFGCGVSAEELDGAGSGGSSGGVTITHQGTVGPYDTVTLSTKTPGALNDWLTAHGYNVDPTSQPVIDAYVAGGFDFIALRLQPGKGVQEMTPVRVVSPGANPELPLRMVAVGTGDKVPIVLEVISEGRWKIQNFAEDTLDPRALIWDYKTNDSNYPSVRAASLAQNDGKGWLTTDAMPGLQLQAISDDDFESDLISAYTNQARSNGEVVDCFVGPLPSSGVVTNTCPDGALDSPNCGAVAPGQVDARTLGCAKADDFAVALDGMHLEDVWVSRFEAELPHDALAADLELTASPDQTPVSRNLLASIPIHTENACPTVSAPPIKIELGTKGGSGGATTGLILVAMTGVALSLTARRLRRAS